MHDLRAPKQTSEPRLLFLNNLHNKLFELDLDNENPRDSFEKKWYRVSTQTTTYRKILTFWPTRAPNASNVFQNMPIEQPYSFEKLSMETLMNEIQPMFLKLSLKIKKYS